MDINRILVPTDFSEDSRLALENALDLAREHNAEVHVLHVIELPMFPAYPGLSMSDARPRLHDEHAQMALDKLLEKVDYPPLKGCIEIGHAPTRIVEYASEHDIDMIVIATHGRRGLAHLLMGSTTERVIRVTHCPVLVIRHPHRRLPKPTTNEAPPSWGDE